MEGDGDGSGFADHFSGHADRYAAHRPRYPAALFEYLAALCPKRELAWDCACGNGQAAVAIAPFFERVVATDASAAQLRHAPEHPRVEYMHARGEDCPLGSSTVDLTVIAQALHWLDVDRFCDEVRRVGRPDSVVAAWGYGLHRITPAVDAVVERFYHEIVGPFWPERRQHIEAHYRTIPFPFAEQRTPPFVMQHEWTLMQLVAYVGTWSAVQRYRRHHDEDPIALIADELAAAWGRDERRRVEWPIFLRVGSVDGP